MTPESQSQRDVRQREIAVNVTLDTQLNVILWHYVTRALFVLAITASSCVLTADMCNTEMIKKNTKVLLASQGQPRCADPK